MVWKTALLFAKNQSAVHIYRKSQFIDRLRLSITGGTGGAGYPKINGVGGSGGSVYLEASEKATLQKVMRKYPERVIKAPSGIPGKKTALIGKPGKDLVIEVPLGVNVITDDNSINADLMQTGDKVLVAQGGEGGSPRNNFLGKRGSKVQVSLYLKLIADIGFVGFPNAGKSTMLRALSRAKPKVANYPFTTITPNIGIMEYSDFRQISCADLPGLIEGAHRNFGFGHNFLRHVERTSLLLFVVDVQGFRLNERSTFRNAYETVMSLNKELELYQQELLSKPAVLVVNKLDTEGAEEKFAELKEQLRSDEAYELLPEEIKPETRIEFKETLGVIARDMGNTNTLKENLRKQLDLIYEEKRAESDSQREPIKLDELNRQLI